MPVKLGYKSIDESGGGKAISGKRVIDRLRSIKIFSKKDENDLTDNKLQSQKTNNDDNASISETTAALSPLKGDESDSYDEKFDLYFASAYLPHMPVANKDDLDKLEGRPSIHFKAFAEASEMEIPPAPPQKARTRRRLSMNVESSSVLRPTNLFDSFENTKGEPQPNAITKTKEHLRSFGNELIEAVEHSHADFNLMLKRISSEKSKNLQDRFTEQDPPAIAAVEPKTTEESADFLKTTESLAEATPETATSKKSMVPKTMEEFKDYLSQFRSNSFTSDNEDSYKKYHALFKSKMGSLAKTLSSVAPDVTQAPSSCEVSMCNFMEVADELFNPTMNQSGYVSNTVPLSETWLEVHEDSDSVSKLTIPFHNSELSVSALSEFTNDEAALFDAEALAADPDIPSTRPLAPSYDW